MAKKAIAQLQTGKGKTAVKCIKMVKSDKSDAFLFEESMIPVDRVKDFFNK